MADGSISIVLVQLRRDILASALATAIRRTHDLRLVEPAPGGPEMLDVLQAADGPRPVVVVIGDPPLLAANSAVLNRLQLDFVLVTIPITGSGLRLELPEIDLEKLIDILRSVGTAGAAGTVRKGSACFAKRGGHLLPPTTNDADECQAKASMFTALFSTSQALSTYLRLQLENVPAPGLGFGGGGTRVVSINSPHEMRVEMKQEGLSVWLYRIVRDDMRLNLTDERISRTLLSRPPLPLRLHYLITPVTFKGTGGGMPDFEQKMMGRVLQALHTKPILTGTDLADTDLEGTDAELHVHLETLALDELSRVWEALEGSFQLAVPYEITVVNIDADLQPKRVVPVEIMLPEIALIAGVD
jgi:hypothetical protein